MPRPVQFALALVLAAVAMPVIAAPAHAQFGNIFGNQPPRPPEQCRLAGPGSGRRRCARYSAGTHPAGADPSAARFGHAAAGLRADPAAGAAARLASRSTTPATAPNPLPGLAPGQRQTRRDAPGANPHAVQPGDEVVTAPPAQKIVNKQAVFSGLDKITGRIIKFDVDMAETVQFGALRVKPQACYTRPATEAANTDAFVEVDEITLQGEVKRIFSGWMFAASPGLSGVEHPIYDVWLTDCKGPEATVACAEPAPPPRAPPPTQQKKQAAGQAPGAATAAAAIPAAAGI